MIKTNLFQEDMHSLYEMELASSHQIVDENFSTVFDVHQLLLKLFLKIKNIRLKRLSYLEFAANHSSFIEWAQKSLIDIIRFLDQTKTTKKHRKTIGEKMYSSAICCLIEFAEMTEMEGVTQKYCQSLVNFLVKEPLLLKKSINLQN